MTKKKRPKRIDKAQADYVKLTMRRPKRELALAMYRMDVKMGASEREMADLRARKAEFEANASRLKFLLARHSTLEEWANSARRVVYAVPGLTNE